MRLRPHPPAGLAHALALTARPANEPNGPPRTLRPAGPPLLSKYNLVGHFDSLINFIYR